MKPIRSVFLTILLVTGTVALAGPVTRASAATLPTFPGLNGYTFPTSFGSFPTGFTTPVVAGNQISIPGCAGTYRPSLGGNNGSTSAQSCGAVLNFAGPQIGQIASVIGPTIIGSPNVVVNVSAGSITEVGGD